MVQRPIYLSKIEPFIDIPMVKVITGIRRSGKSELLKMIRQKLLDRGVEERQIVYVNYESLQWEDYQTYKALYAYVGERRAQLDGKRLYLFVDEIQEVESWEKAVNSMFAEWDIDIYITGSNSRLLSSDLSTYLAGRYVECSIFTLSFAEYLMFRKANPASCSQLARYFDDYLRKGGFPAAHANSMDAESIYLMVSDIYSSVLLRDTVQRFKIRNVEMLNRLVQFLFTNIGNTFSASSISKYLKSQNRNIGIESVYNYLSALESSFIIHRIQRYDLRGKEILQTQEKYYVTDLSLLFVGRGYRPDLIGGMLENLVCMELMRRGYQVFVGKMGQMEVDFVAKRNDRVIYVQVCENMDSEDTRKRELAPLCAIKDSYPKFVVVNNPRDTGNINGIECMFVADFLTKQEI